MNAVFGAKIAVKSIKDELTVKGQLEVRNAKLVFQIFDFRVRIKILTSKKLNLTNAQLNLSKVEFSYAIWGNKKYIEWSTCSSSLSNFFRESKVFVCKPVVVLR